ncbi:MAG TPA: hypothetical protein VHM91_11175 [Verrucomicrobiales bacterium]|jgi:hypothetical protein|nr:hypothetical protein [Verrucomicrobiales bacterium]
MKGYHLKLSPAGEWELIREDQEFSLAAWKSKEAAVESSTDIVSRRAGSLTLFRADGTVERKWQFHRGGNPAVSSG